MSLIRFGLLFLPLLALAACGGTPSGSTLGPMALAPEPAKVTAAALQATDVSRFVDAGAMALLSDKDRTEATSAQFYALQYGRPSAPRQWQGDSGNSGKISVGPYVRVNDRDCRAFAHDVTIKGAVFHKEGMACRLEGGTWEPTEES